MIDHIQKDFSEHLEVIQKMKQKDEVFAEMCANYEELCTWFAARMSEKKLTTEECMQTIELIKELQVDIAETIKESST